MTVEELIAQAEANGPKEEIGRIFFSGFYSANDIASFLRYFLSGKKFIDLYKIIGTAHINDVNKNHFEIFIRLCNESGLELYEYIEMLCECIRSPESAILKKWGLLAFEFLKRKAETNFDNVLELLLKTDSDFKCFNVLMKTDLRTTITVLTEFLLTGKNVNKRAIRKFLYSYKADVAGIAEKRYHGAPLNVREAAVRLMLLYKNDARTAESLNTIMRGDKSNKIRSLIEKDFGLVKSDKKPKATRAKNQKYDFMRAMREGTEFFIGEFKKLISTAANSLMASELFYNIIKNNTVTEVVTVENGKICNLDNEEVNFEDGVKISVLHPCEIPQKYEFIKRLNITQTSNQLKRKVFYCGEPEKNTGCCARLKGTVLTENELKRKLKSEGFKLTCKDSDNNFSGAVLFLKDYACLLEFSKTDFNGGAFGVTLGEIKFYRFKDIIKHNGQYLFSNVPRCPASEINKRTYSEFLHSVYKAAGLLCKTS